MSKLKKQKTKQINEQVTKTNVQGEEYTNIRSIDELWGINKIKYKQKTLEDYTKYILELTDFELRRHANELNIRRDTERPELIENLKRLFKSDFNRKNIKTEFNNIEVVTSNINDKIASIWAEK